LAGFEISGFVSPHEARDALASPYPVLLARGNGVIAVSNRPADWLFGLGPAETLEGENFYDFLAREIDQNRIPIGCIRLMVTKKKLTMKALAARRLSAHDAFLSAVAAAEAGPYRRTCPVGQNTKHHFRPPLGRRRYTYPFTIRNPNGGTKPEYLLFNVTDAEFWDNDDWFLIACLPADSATERVLERCAVAGSGAGDTKAIASLDAAEPLLNAIERDEGPRRRALGARLRDLRQGAGLSAKALAEQMDVTMATVNHWELGRRGFQDRQRFVKLMTSLQAAPEDRRGLAALAGYPASTGALSESRDEALTLTESSLGAIAALQTEILARQDRLAALQADVAKLQTELFERISRVRAELQDQAAAQAHGDPEINGAPTSAAARSRETT
jgi:transcriptional regulator with XRE-family HTH domain